MGWMLLSDSVSLLLLLSLSRFLVLSFHPNRNDYISDWLSPTPTTTTTTATATATATTTTASTTTTITTTTGYWQNMFYIYTYIYACSYYFIPSKSAPKKNVTKKCSHFEVPPLSTRQGKSETLLLLILKSCMAPCMHSR